MKYFSIIVILFVSYIHCFAQSEISRQYQHRSNQPLSLDFDEASIVNVSGWDEDYISVQAIVVINDNLQNDNYEIEDINENGQHLIRGSIKDKERIPRVIRIKKGDEIFTFQTDDWDSPEILDFYAKHGADGIQWKSQGISWDIKINVKVPKDTDLKIESKHGIIELTDFSSDVMASSTHGGIDLTVDAAENAKIDAKTQWGTIYSNVKMNIDEALSSDDQWNHIVANVNDGTDHKITLESRHANIYLRSK
jgi:hypothetical protein